MQAGRLLILNVWCSPTFTKDGVLACLKVIEFCII